VFAVSAGESLELMTASGQPHVEFMAGKNIVNQHVENEIAGNKANGA
jgi:hypothetical protein